MGATVLTVVAEEKADAAVGASAGGEEVVMGAATIAVAGEEVIVSAVLAAVVVELAIGEDDGVVTAEAAPSNALGSYFTETAVR